MDWSDFSWVPAAVLVGGIVVCTCIALLQIVRAERLQLLGRALWILGVVFVPYLGAAAWFFYGRAWARQLG